MSLGYEELRSEVMRRAVALGVTPGTAAMQTMTLRVMAMAKDLPVELLDGVVVAHKRWLVAGSQESVMDAIRVASWRFLEAKNGNSATMEDRIDVAAPALICVLWDEADEGGEMEDGLEFFAFLIKRYGDLSEHLR